MNLDKVLDKVNEVKFYSEKLHGVHNPAVPGNPDEFRYYFSAFLNAVYSVQQFAKTKAMEELQRQGKKKSEREWQKYEKDWCDTLTANEQELWWSLLRYGGIRGIEVHQDQRS